MNRFMKLFYSSEKCIACDSTLKWGYQDGRVSQPSCTNQKCARYGLCTSVMAPTEQKRFKVTYVDWVTAITPEAAISMVAENADVDLFEKFATAEEDSEEEGGTI